MQPLVLLLALTPSLVAAHFKLNVPTSRGDDDETQATSPCGGLKVSSTRDEWPISGGQIKFEAGHDEANTAVYLAIGNDPSAEDFNITLKDKFLQVGMGTFCWNSLAVPSDLNIKAGTNASIQVVQEGHTGGGLYNCADITFTDAEVNVNTCSNSTGVTAEDEPEDHSASASASSSSSATSSSPSETASGTAESAAASSTGNAASGVRVAEGMLFAGSVAVAALMW